MLAFVEVRISAASMCEVFASHSGCKGAMAYVKGLERRALDFLQFGRSCLDATILADAFHAAVESAPAEVGRRAE